MARWSLRLLGPFLSEAGGEPLAGFRSDKVRALLAYLAVHVDRPWSRATLADLLWPELPERTARSNLRNALSNLRSVLTDHEAVPPFVHVTPDTVRADATAARWVDVDAFLGLLPEAGMHPDGAAEPATVARLERALALYRGEFLEGFDLDSAPFESWQAATRERLQREASRAARALAHAHLQVGDVAAAANATRRWLELDPWDEAAHRHMMRALVLQGRRAAALAQYEACRRALADELGAEPASETVRQYEAIRDGHPVPLEDAHGMLSDSGVALSWPGLHPQAPSADEGPPFVGRESELAALEAGLEGALAGRSGVLLVTGDAGSGKTALLAEFVRRALARHPPLLIAWGQCSAFSGHGDPFEPFVSIARMLTGEVGGPPATRASGVEMARRLWQRLPESIDALLEHGPDLVDRLVSGRTLLYFARRHGGVGSMALQRLERLSEGRSGISERPTQRLQTTLFEQLTASYRALALRRPLVLVIDDMQWIDAGSVDLFFHLARSLGDSRVLLLGAYRAEEAALRHDHGAQSLLEVVGELRAAHGEVCIDLTHAAGPSFVDGLLDSEPNRLGPAFRQRLFERTSGNPLFTIELLRGMQLRGDLRRDRAGRWSEGPTLHWEALPARVEAVIAQRIGHLSPACQNLLAAASVEGETFTAEVAAAVSGCTVEQAFELLSREAGRQHRVVSAQGVRAVEGRGLSLYRFRHGLFQTYLYHQLDVVEQAHLHGQVGHELERLYQPSAEQHPAMAHVVARHFAAAGLAREAVGAYVTAARHALRLSANAEAVAHLRSALEQLHVLPPSTARDQQELELQLALGPPLTASKGWAPPELAATYARAEELCAGIEDGARLIPALWLLSVFRIGRSEHTEVCRLWERMVRLAHQAGDPSLVSLASLNVSLFYQGRLAEARRLFEQATALVDEERQAQLAQRFGMAPAIVALAYLPECLWLLGMPHEAEQRGVEARTLADALGHPMTSCYVRGRATWLAALRGDPEATRACAADLHHVATAHGNENFVLAAAFFERYASMASTRSPTDLDRMHQSMERYRRSGTVLNRSAFLTHMARACLEAGALERALAAVDASLALALRTGELWFQAEAWRTKGDALLGRARADARSTTHRQRLERAARACFATAQLTARRQGAAALEQRAAAALAAL